MSFVQRSSYEPIPEQLNRGSLSPLALAGAAISRWRSALALALVCAGAMAAATFAAFPAEYTASSMLKFRFDDFLIVNERGGNSNAREELENNQRTQVAFVKSHVVLEEAAKSDPRVLPAWRLSKELRVGFSEGTPVMSISLTGQEPEALALSIKAVVEAYKAKSVDAERGELIEKAAQLDKAIKKAGSEIEEKKKILNNNLGNRIDDPQTKAAEAELLSTSIELTRTQLELEKRSGSIIRSRLKLKTIDTAPVDRAILDEKLDLLPAVAEAQAGLTKLEVAESEIRSRFTSPSESPQVIKAAEATRRQRELVQKTREDLVSKAEAQYRRQQKSELLAAIAKEEEEVAGLLAMEKTLKTRRTAGTNNLPSRLAVDGEMSMKAIEQDEEVFKALRTRHERLKIELQSGGPKVVVLQEAETPSSPNVRSQLVKTTVAGSAGFLLGWLAIGLLETRSRRVRDGRVLSAHTGLRILGAIPSGAPANAGLLRPDDLGLAVAADLLRTSLQLDDRLRARRTLVVTSATEGEGKSTLAILLAGSFARAGFRTLLVDADLRNPTIGRRLGVFPRPGLSESLTLTAGQRARSRPEEVDESGEIEEIDGLPLGLIQAGANGQMAAPRLARADLRAWFASLRKHWEYIIIDTPPVLPVPDAAFLSKAADGVVLCARAGISRVEQVNTAVDHIGSLGIDCLGIVMNDVRGARPTYYGSGRIEAGSLEAPALIAPRSIES